MMLMVIYGEDCAFKEFMGRREPLKNQYVSPVLSSLLRLRSPIGLTLLRYLAIVHSQAKEAIVVILEEAMLPRVLVSVWEEVKWLVTQFAHQITGIATHPTG
jgi:hypothetical protein